MLRIPTEKSKVRALIDMEFLGQLGDLANVRKLPTFREALNSGRKYLEAERAARAVNTYTLRADGELWLVKVTRGKWSCLWNFGKIAP